MKILVNGGLLNILVFLSLHYPSPQSNVDGPEKRTNKAQLARAKLLFKEQCARCHGADGRGQTVTGAMLDVPDFTDQAWWKDNADDERLMESVRNGKSGMPKFGKKLSSQQIALLVTYVRRFEKSSR